MGLLSATCRCIRQAQQRELKVAEKGGVQDDVVGEHEDRQNFLSRVAQISADTKNRTLA
jgi:hypothetical protein